MGLSVLAEPDLLSELVVLMVLVTALAMVLATVVPTWRTPVPAEPSWHQVPTPPVGKSKADTVGGRSTIHTRPTNHAKTEEYAYILNASDAFVEIVVQIAPSQMFIANIK